MVVLDAVKEVVKRYGNRRRDVIYAHMLEKPIYVALEEEGVPQAILENPMVLIGELVHRGVSNVLENAEPRCRRVWIKSWLLDDLVYEARSRWVRENGIGNYVVVCGTADAVVGGIPVEVKTTRSQTIKPEWVIRSQTYAWLYDTPHTLLVVLNLADAYEKVIKIPNPGDGEMQGRVIRWLQGRWPGRTASIVQFLRW